MACCCYVYVGGPVGYVDVQTASLEKNKRKSEKADN